MQQPVQEMISREYARCALIGHLSQPKSRRLEGWGAPGTPYEGVQFRPAILETTNVLGMQMGARFSTGFSLLTFLPNQIQFLDIYYLLKTQTNH